MSSGSSVWIVDDDEIHQFIATRILLNIDPSLRVACFGNGKIAINQLKKANGTENLPDLIFLDINMPVMDGWAFLEEYKRLKNSLAKKVIIFIVSSSVHSNDITRGEQCGEVKDYVFKPLDLTIVKNMLARYNRSAA